MKTLSEGTRKLLIRELSGYDAVVITGGSSGIGGAFLEVIDEVARVKLCNISRNAVSHRPVRADFLDIRCDLTKDEEISAVLPSIFEFIGLKNELSPPKILLINNSGFGAYGYFPEPDIARNCNMVDLNIRAMVRLCGEFAHYIKEGKGAVINVASTASFQACPSLAVYAATKAFVLSFSLAISYEFSLSGAKCLCLCPGPTATNFFSAAGFTDRPLPKWFGHTSEDVAIAALKALAKGKTLKVVGFFNSLGASASRILPPALLVKISGALLSVVRSKK